MKIYFSILLSFVLSMGAYAQNPHSLNPIDDYEIMFQTSLWFRVDMRQKINAPFFAKNREFSRLLINAVKSDKIIPYTNDSLTSRMDKAKFLKNITFLENEEEQEEDFFTDQDDFENSELSDDAQDYIEYTPQQLYIFEIKENLVFDKRRSRIYHDILAVTLVIPADQTPTGVEKEIGTFSLKELVENVFKNNDQAVWYNHQNPAAHHNLTDAFALRLFGGQLVKTQNARNLRFEEIYDNPRRALIASEQALYKLIEYEALLWEY